MDLPEIRTLVGSFLDSHDLCSCVRVCGLWHETFIPFIYTQAKPTTLHLHWRSFQPRLCHVRDLSIVRATEPHVKEHLLKICQRLVRLHFASDSSPEAIDYLVCLLQRNPQLVQVSLGIFEKTPYQKMWRALIDDCPRLTEIEIHSTDFEDASLNGLLELAPRLTRLELVNCNLSRLLAWMSLPPRSSSFGSAEDQSNGNRSNDSSILGNKDWSGFPVLRELSMSVQYGQDNWMDQLQIFVRAPQLERLSWNIINLHQPYVRNMASEEFAPTLLRLLRRRPWPKLKSLEVTEDQLGRLSSLHDKDLAEILTLLPNGLKSFRIPGADFGLFAWQAIQRHLGTLQVLYLTKVPSWMVQGFLTSCPELRELKGPTLNPRDLVHGAEADLMRKENAVAVTAMLVERGLPETLMMPPPQKEVALSPQRESVGALGSNSSTSIPIEDMTQGGLPEDQSPRPWVCLRLNVLQIKFRRNFEWREERKRTDSQVFQQLSQLRCLRELTLCPFRHDHKDHGVDPCLALGMEMCPLQFFQGQLKNATRIREHHIGERLLEIWPGLTVCYWHNY